MTITEAFGDIALLLAKMDPSQIVKLKAPQEMSQRVEALTNKKKEGKISNEENVELERFLALDIFIGLAKARARLLLNA